MLILSGLAVIALFFSAYQMTNKSIKAVKYNDKTVQFVHRSPQNTLEKLKNKEAGVYYFGFPTCPWCIELLPVLDKELKKQNFTAYVVNTRAENYSDRDNNVLEKFFIERTDEKEVTVPFVVAINRKGAIQTHIGTVSTHDAKKREMTVSEKKDLERILFRMINFSKG